MKDHPFKSGFVVAAAFVISLFAGGIGAFLVNHTEATRTDFLTGFVSVVVCWLVLLGISLLPD